MKSLRDYTREPTKELLTSCGAIYALAKQSAEALQVEGVSYIQHDSGALVPEENYSVFSEKLKEIVAQGIAQDMADNGKNNIIRRTLFTENVFVTQDIDGVVNLLECYGITRAEVVECYQSIRLNEDVYGYTLVFPSNAISR